MTELAPGGAIPPPSDGNRLAVLEAEVAALQLKTAQLQQALETRIVIEQAKGAVSARLGTTPDVAFEMMRGLARSERRNLREFAAEVVANRGRLAPSRLRAHVP